MSESLVLTKDFNKIPAGTELEFVKENAGSYIVKTPKGRRLVIPKKHFATKEEPVTIEVVELQEWQHDLFYKPIMDFYVAEGEVPTLDELELDWDTMEENTELSHEVLVKDAEFILDHVRKGSSFKLPDGPTVKTPKVGAEMSEDERSVLKDMVEGKEYDISKVTVTSDTAPEVEEPEPILGENQVLLSTITNGRLPDSGIDWLIDRYPEDHFPEDQRCDIPDVDENHYWDPNVLECLITSYKTSDKALITGLPGTGKTTSVKQFAAWIRIPYMRLQGRGDLETSSFLGYTGVVAEELEGQAVSVTKFHPGMLTTGVQNGYLVTIDEVMKIPSYIQMCMQHLYEKDGYLTVDEKEGDKIIHPAPSFMMVLTDNVKGVGDDFDKFSATQMQDSSTLDRINTNETLDYMPPAAEEAMLQRMFPEAKKGTIKDVVKLAGLIRTGYKKGQLALTMSPRGLISVFEKMGIGLPIERALEMTYLNKLADETEIMSVKDMLKTVGITKGGF